MYVIGTAGHVDHGKSTLVHALTGIHPDRLREEREREMTIDLGFAWLTLPSGREVSIVDVPGHEDFIKNMLAGVGGIDVALLVVAADEAVMPQTREHLAILDLLEVGRGVVALTKCDLISDPDWLDLVAEEIREELAGTVLAAAPIVPVSAHTGAGLPALLQALDELLAEAPAQPDRGQPRLPIDRVFTMTGFGTVVTGTLLDGKLSVGDEVEVVPGRIKTRIRGLQTHKSKVSEVEPGSRVAANLTGVSVEEIHRGQVLGRPGSLEATTLVDARLRLLSSAPWPLKHNAIVDFFVGAARAQAHVRLLDAEILEPGTEGWVQYRLTQPLAMLRGDRYILRLPSPSVTLGGGRVLQVQPGRRHRRFRPEVVARLEALARGTPEDVLAQTLAGDVVLEAREAARRSQLSENEAYAALRTLVARGEVLTLDRSETPRPTTGVIWREGYQRRLTRVRQALAAFHRRYPLRAGMPREELKSRARLDGALFAQFIDFAATEGSIAANATMVALPEHRVTLSAEQEEAVRRVLARFAAERTSPPAYSQVEAELGADLLQSLIEQGCLVRVSDAVLFDADGYAQAERRVMEHLRAQGSITVAEVRDLLGTSRKYALGLLEEMDRRHITKRMGDARVLR